MKVKIKSLAGYLILAIAVGFIFSFAKATSYNVGYRTTTFQATTPLGTKTYSAYFWYPTNDTPGSYNYGSITSSVVLNGNVAPGQHPTVVFSHGDLGCPTQSVFITESLAKAGYVVAAITYQDAATSCGGSGTQSGEPSFNNNNPTGWSDTSYLYRKYDTSALIDKLISMNSDSSSFLNGAMNVNNLGFVGHSLGGYTGAALSGGWASWLDSRIHAALLLSPYIEPYTQITPAPNIRIPIMLQGGTLDSGITPTLQSFYNLLNYQKYFLVLKTAGHLAWTNSTCNSYSDTAACLAGSSVASAIVSYGQSFLDTYIAQTSASVNTTIPNILNSYVYSTSVPLPAPTIGSFTASSNTITAGQSATLSWSTTNATSVSISPGVGSVSASGSISVSPAATTAYTLTATNSQNNSVTQSVTITVQPPSSNSTYSSNNVTYNSAVVVDNQAIVPNCAFTDGCTYTYSFDYGTNSTNLSLNSGTFSISYPWSNGGTTYNSTCNCYVTYLDLSGTLSNLQPNTTYYYRLAGDTGAPASFATSPVPPMVTLIPNPTSASIGSPIPSWPGNYAAYNFTVSCPGGGANANTVLSYSPVSNTLPPGTSGFEFYDFGLGSPPYGPYGTGSLACTGSAGESTYNTLYIYLGQSTPVGTYNITLGVSTNDGSPVVTPNTIQLVVTAPATVNLTCTNSCNYAGLASGANPSSQTLSISNTGGSSLSWTAAKQNNSSWLTLSPTSGTTAAGGSSSVTVSVNTTGLSVGNYNDTITVTSGSTTKTMAVSLAVGSSGNASITQSVWTILDSNGNPLVPPVAQTLNDNLGTTGVNEAMANYASTGLLAGSYQAKLVVTNSNGGSSTVSKPFTVLTALTPPSSPGGGTASNYLTPPVGSVPCGSVKLAWTDQSTNEDGFKVYRNTSNNFSTATQQGANILTTTQAGTGTVYSYQYSPANGTPYYYWVVAYNGGGQSAPLAFGSLADTSCAANFTGSDKDIIAINGNNISPVPTQCGGTDPLPAGTTLNLNDKLTFQINICNDNGTLPASGISIVDSMINLAQPPLAQFPAGWNLCYNGSNTDCVGTGGTVITAGSGSGHYTVSGTSPNQTLTINLTGSGFNVSAGGRATLTFDAVLAVPANAIGISSRFQNSFTINYNGGTDSGATPALLFYTGKGNPSEQEIAP